VAIGYVFGVGVFLLPLEPGRAWLMAAAAFAATNGPFENLSLLSLIQPGVPDARRWRRSRYGYSSSYGTPPVMARRELRSQFRVGGICAPAQTSSTVALAGKADSFLSQAEAFDGL
jgi:hypothetical protein